MKKRFFIISAITGMATLFLVGGILAGTDVSDVITMKNKAYKKHKKGIVEFTHKKHMDDYAKKAPELYKAGCGECHHDENNKPLKLKVGDDVQNCIECHKKPGRPPGKIKKEWRAEKLSKDEKKELKLAWHAEAIHYNCKDCHRDYKKMTKKKTAPTSCSKCHPKKKK